MAWSCLVVKSLVPAVMHIHLCLWVAPSGNLFSVLRVYIAEGEERQDQSPVAEAGPED